MICLLTGVAWPPDIFFAGSGSRVGVSVPGYRVEYAQQWGMDFYTTFYEVTRQDGRRAFLEIDGDDDKCWTLETREVETRVYFLCDEDTITEQTSYFDKDLSLYAGWTGCTRSLDELAFRDYSGNPLVGRSAGEAVNFIAREAFLPAGGKGGNDDLVVNRCQWFLGTTRYGRAWRPTVASVGVSQ